METGNPSALNKARGLNLIFRALGYRNYRLFFIGQGISLTGTWMQQIAMGWLVYRLTNSAFLLGLVGFVSQIPAFLLTPFAGVMADRWSRRYTLVATQSLAMVQALILATLVLTEAVTVWQIIPLSLLLGLVNAFDAPARQSFVVEMVERKEDLGNAIALNSTLFNAARLIGPSIGGILIAAVGEGMCFLINGISYLAVIVALLAIRVSPREVERSATNILQGFKDGFTYVFGFVPIRTILLLLSMVSLMGMPYMILMPVFARDVLHGGPHTLGFLMAASGTGALAGALYLASRRNVRGLMRIIPLASSMFGFGLIAFSFSRSFWISLALMPLTGFGMIVQMAASNTVLQTIVDDDKRGRVMSFYTMAFMGMMPFGSLLAGSLASRIGAPDTLLFGGACCIVGALLFARKLPTLRKFVRPIYIRMGIIPEPTIGDQGAGAPPFPPEN